MYFAAANKHFTALKLFEYFGRIIIKYLPVQ